MNFKTFKHPQWQSFIGLLCLLTVSYVNAYIPLDRIVAIVNDDVIMQSEFHTKLRAVHAQIAQQGSQPPPPAILERQVLDGLIQNQIQLQLAQRAGIKIDDETLNQTITEIAARNNVSLSEFKKILEQDGYHFDQFRETIRAEITLTQLRKRQVLNRIVVTDKEINNFLANEIMQDNLESEVRLAHLLLSLPTTATAEKIEQTKQIAIQIQKDLLAGGDFAALAKSTSDGNNAEAGGDLGWRKISAVPTLFTNYIPDMKKGDISEVIQSSSGFHIIKLIDVKNDEGGSDTNIVKQSQARHILIKTDALTTDQQAQEKLAQLKLRIAQGDSFDLLARGNSNDPMSAIEGGALGWRLVGELTPKFQQVMDSLEINQISEPFQTDFGWHIVQVLARRDFDNTQSVKRSKAQQAIYARKLNEAMQNWAQELRNEAYVEYRLNDG